MSLQGVCMSVFACACGGFCMCVCGCACGSVHVFRATHSCKNNDPTNNRARNEQIVEDIGECELPGHALSRTICHVHEALRQTSCRWLRP